MVGKNFNPLIKYTNKGNLYPPFPFTEDILAGKSLFICINKTGTPLVLNKYEIDKNEEFCDCLTDL